MRALIHRIVLLLAAVLLLATGLGCGKDKPLSDMPGAKPPAHTTVEPPVPPISKADSADYFKDASSVPGKFKAKIGGPVRLLELVLYPGYVIAKIQDPKKRENVDEYELRNGQIGDSTPVRFVGTTPTAKDLDKTTADIATVDFAAVPKMTKDALAQLKIDDGTVTHMVLKRGRPFNNDVRWRVYVSGARKSGSVEYDPAGHRKKVWN